jgi:hypothetical protein
MASMLERLVVVETKLIELEARIRDYESDKQWFVRAIGGILVGAIAGILIQKNGLQ